MIDFTGLPRRNKTYAGANGNKIAIVYEGAQYMLKFPAPPTRNKDMSYANGCVSEYLGSHIFQMAGIPAQDTLLGVYTKNGRERVVVACRDFTTDGSVLQDFASLKNTIIDSERNGYIGTSCNIFPSLFKSLSISMQDHRMQGRQMQRHSAQQRRAQTISREHGTA